MTRWLSLFCLVVCCSGCANTVSGYAEDRYQAGDRMADSVNLIADSLSDALANLNAD